MRNEMQGRKRPTLHTRLIEALVAQSGELRRSGFIRTLKAEVRHAEGQTLGWMDDEYDLGLPRLIPDAYRIDHAAKIAVAYEVEVSCPIRGDRFWLYDDPRLILDEFDYTLLVITLDRYGIGRLHDVTNPEIWGEDAVPYLLSVTLPASGVSP